MKNDYITVDFTKCHTTPNQLRWKSRELQDCDFVDSLKTVCGAGDAMSRNGLAIYTYACKLPMTNKAFYNSDGDLLIVPQQGSLDIKTEFGNLFVDVGEIVVIQRGIKFSIVSKNCKGYICEVFDGHYELPDLGPIGSNGLANERDFLYPVASYEDIDEPYKLVTKYGGKMFESQMDHSPFDVVGWYGNYAPYKYDLSKFNVIGTVSFDHPDPSIFTVLTVKSATPGVAMCDFVIFPPRWAVAENTFRPPYFHRNCMSEFMGLINGGYDAKKGFVEGGYSLHSIMTAHGPDSKVFEEATHQELKPVKVEGLAFMFESKMMMDTPTWAIEEREVDYQQCWQGLKKRFNGTINPW